MSAYLATSSSKVAASTSDDPYAPFYYWDASANNWGFDYNSYYATYGYPADYYASTDSASSSVAAAYGDPSAAANPYYFDTQNPAQAAAVSTYDTPIVDPFTNATPSSANNIGKEDVRYDSEGRIIPGKLRKGETRPTVLRRAAGKLWEDQTLLEWDPSHKRLFVGDLGNDVTDETLIAAFDKYPSFSKARVVTKKDGKGKGYGFVAFADPEDFLKAWKEMNGKYIGSRPCRLKKAADVVNPVEIGARKDRMLAISAKEDRKNYKQKMGGAVGKGLRRVGGSSYGK
ncbi:related to RNA-binding protein [Melanopsichium pennsylvanicum]|uniref:Related to RNA-binding protein n=2 Tax=Melanopsichium pennsylvanicum TaxID=63383 RepID=A0AAJ5C3I2_9BASI|nr:related to RNA-binding protein [Melanopsichium pennsylvanicum 4]SNX82650.1 related to RNA-binding protein [Melanopsichium pennsylvanicum]